MQTRKTLGKTLALGSAGLLAGFVNGLLGAGGGIVVVRALTRFSEDVFEDKRDIFVHALAIMLPLSALSVLQYALSGQLAGGTGHLWLLPALLGGMAGALLLGKLKIGTVNRLFALLVVWSGLRMLTR